MKLGDKIKQKLKEKGISQKDLARLTSVSYATMHRYINGKTSPRLSVLNEIALILGISVNELLSDSPEKLSLKERILNFFVRRFKC